MVKKNCNTFVEKDLYTMRRETCEIDLHFEYSFVYIYAYIYIHTYKYTYAYT